MIFQAISSYSILKSLFLLDQHFPHSWSLSMKQLHVHVHVFILSISKQIVAVAVIISASMQLGPWGGMMHRAVQQTWHAHGFCKFSLIVQSIFSSPHWENKIYIVIATVVPSVGLLVHYACIDESATVHKNGNIHTQILFI